MYPEYPSVTPLVDLIHSIPILSDINMNLRTVLHRVNMRPFSRRLSFWKNAGDHFRSMKGRASELRQTVHENARDKVRPMMDQMKTSRIGSTTLKAVDQVRSLLPETANIKNFGNDVSEEIKGIIIPEYTKDKAYSKRQKEKENPSMNQEYKGPKDVMNVVQPLSNWEKVKGAFKGTAVEKNVEKVHESLKTTRVYKQGQKVGDVVTDKIEDVREVYETSQAPIMWHVRDIGDNITADSDEAIAMGELKKMDPNFTVPGFLEEMENYMIPEVVSAYLKADVEVLRGVCEGNALRNVNAECTRRINDGLVMDDTIVDISNVDYHDVIMLDGEFPVVTLTFMCQHIDCVRDLAGEVIQGSESKLHTVHYTFVMRKDLENPDFNWKIVDLAIQGIAGYL